MNHRVAVTGMGIICPAGCSPEEVWLNVRRGRSAVRRLTRFDPGEFRSQLGAEVDGFEFADHVKDSGGPGRMDRFSQFGVAAACLALAHSNLARTRFPRQRSGVFLGSALGGVAYGEEQHTSYLKHGTRAISPSLALSIFSGAAATNVAIRSGFTGPTLSNANSCASGAISIGEAFRRVRCGEIDIALAGGAECPLAPLTFGAFSIIRAMSSHNGDASGACRPFDRDRDGFVMGEGAAVLVLENLELSQARNARSYAEILGFGTTNDAHHMTVPLSDGTQAARAMQLALEDAGIERSAVDYIHAHATGTRLGDQAEAVALQTVFPDGMPPVCATKPIHGHALGASPAIEAILTIMAMQHDFYPGILNLDNVDPLCKISTVSVPGRPAHPTVALCNAFGFGGINAALVIGRAQ